MLTRGDLFFFTATNLYWKRLMKEDSYKEIVIGSLKHLIRNNELILYGFVIMPNHMHLMLQVPETVPAHRDIQHSLMSFTAHEFKKKIMKDNRIVKELAGVDVPERKELITLEEYHVGDADSGNGIHFL